MKIFNKLATALMALPLLAGLTACHDDHAEYTPAEKLSTYQVYFPTSLAQSVALQADATTFDVELDRVKTDGELTVQLVTTQSEESTAQVTVPTSVTFADGESKVIFPVTYAPESIEYDDANQVTISIADSSYTTPYGSSQYSFSAVMNAPWKSLGKAKFLDAFIYDDVTYFDVEIQQNELDPDHFRLVHPYDEMMKKGGYIDDGYYKAGPDEYFDFYILRKGWSLFDVEATQRDYVYWNDVRTGYYISDYDDGSSTDGEVYAMFPGRFTSLRSEDAWQFNTVVEYFEDGVTPAEIIMAPYYYIFGVGGWNRTTSEGIIRILFPGYVKADYEVTATYAGVLKTPAEANQAVVDFTLSEDIASAKYAMTAASVSEEEAAAAIESGELEAVEITTDSREYIDLEEDGKYRVTIVGFNAEGEAKATASCVFEFTKGESPWQSLGMGLYTDDIVGPLFQADPITYEVEVLENVNTPGLYRLKNAYGADYPYNEEGQWDDSMDYYLEINAEDATSVYFEQQELGVNWGYGMMSAVSNAARYIAAGYDIETIKANNIEFGTLENGVITFPVNGIIVFDNDGGYYANRNGAFKLVLPGAASPSAIKAAKFANRLRGGKGLRNGSKAGMIALKHKSVTDKAFVEGNKRIAKAVK